MTLSFRQFASPEPGPHLLITGGVHGDEFEPMLAIRELIRRLSSDSEATSSVSLSRGTLTLVPIVNEAAFRRGHRTADDNLDLARVCPGRADGSITERTAAALSERIRAADFYIDLHTGGIEFDILPMTGYTLHSDPSVLEVQRRMARDFNLPTIWGTDPTLDGRSLSVARDACVPAIYAEFGGAARCTKRGVEAYVDGCLNVMGSLRMIERIAPTCCVETVVEDPRPASGHMQACNTSPFTGLFLAAVQPGDRVHAGQLLGTVVDAAGDRSHDFLSPHAGVVLVLRSFPRVLEGQSIGVVLEC